MYFRKTQVFLFFLIAQAVLNIQSAFGQIKFDAVILVPAEIDSAFFRTANTTFQENVPPFTPWTRVEIDDGKIHIKGALFGESEFAWLILNTHRLHFILDSGNNVLSVRGDVNQTLSIEPTAGAIETNRALKKTSNLYNEFLSQHGDTVITQPNNEKIVVLNKKEQSEQFIKEKISMIDDDSPSYYGLLEYFDISRRTPSDEIIEMILTSLDSYPDDLKNTDLGRALIYEMTKILSYNEANEIGHTVPKFRVLNDKGESIENQSYAGKPYIIAFSATWCVPCQVYQKKLKEVYNKYRDRGLQVIYFNLDSDYQKWLKHIDENGLDWINVSEKTTMQKSEIAKLFGVTTIPNYLVIDKNEQLIYNDKLMNDPEFNQLEDYVQKALQSPRMP